jgi:hypothetical protein
MNKSREHRAQKKQAEIKQRGPYSCIVLAVADIKNQREGCTVCAFATWGSRRCKARNQARNLTAIFVE